MARATKKAKTPVKINEDFSYVSARDGKTYTMTLKERDFCDEYLNFKGDGVDAIMEVYDVTNPKVAAAMSYEYLRKPHLIAYINSKLEEAGFNDDEVMKQHLFTINQHSDLKSKIAGIGLYYQLKKKIGPGTEPLGIPHQTVIIINTPNGTAQVGIQSKS